MEYDKRIEELQEKIKEIKAQIYVLSKDKNKDKLIKCQDGTNTTLAVFYSIIPYLTLFGTISALYGNGSISIPTELSASIIAGGSLASAAVSKTILMKKAVKSQASKTKIEETEQTEKAREKADESPALKKLIKKTREKIGGFLVSTAVNIKKLIKKAREKEERCIEAEIEETEQTEKKYTEPEIFKKTIGPLIEITKLKNKEQALNTTIEELKKQQKQENAEEIVSKTGQEHTKEIAKLREKLDKCYKKLDDMTLENELYKYSGPILKKTLLRASLFTAFALAPLSLKFAVNLNEVRTPLQTLITLLTPLTISTVACALNIKKQNKNAEPAVAELESESIKRRNNKKAIEELINEIAKTEVELQQTINQKISNYTKVEKCVFEYKFDENYYKTYYKTDLQPCETEEQLQQKPKPKVLVYTIGNQEKGH